MRLFTLKVPCYVFLIVTNSLKENLLQSTKSLLINPLSGYEDHIVEEPSLSLYCYKVVRKSHYIF